MVLFSYYFIKSCDYYVPSWHANVRQCNEMVNYLCDMVASRAELARLDPVVYTGQHVSVNISAVIDTTQVPYEIVETHACFGFQIRCMEVRVQHYNRKC